MSKTPGTFAYPGSKTTYAKWILDHITDHTQYVEPFGGAASILVEKQRSELEVYNDINKDCVNFFKVVRDRPKELKRWVENTPTSRALFNEYVESYPEWPTDTVEWAGRFLYTQQHSFGGKGVTANTASYSTINTNSYRGNDLDSREGKWVAKAEDIPKLRDRFMNVNIECLDYAELIEKYDSKDTFFYFDPPYQTVGDNYYQTESGGFNHSRFVEELQKVDGDWIVSYDENIPSGLDAYNTVRRAKKSPMSTEQPEKVETLTMNYDPEKATSFKNVEQQGLGNFQ